VLIPDMGFGVSQVLPVLVQCYYAPPGSTLIFEQPEIHLHPAVQSALADVFIDVMQHRQMQIIIESHSEHLLRRLQRRIAEKSLTRESIALYFCEMQEGQSRIRELEVDMFGSIRNWPRDFFGDLTEELLVVMEAQLEAAAGAGG
jgi:predicted ATPase